MNVAILGGSGFVGKHVADFLASSGHQVYIWSRSPQDVEVGGNITVEKWPLDEAKRYHHIDAVINLAGETINQRWTSQAKESILKSRVTTTVHLIELIKKNRISPKVIINGSAIGYYGPSKTKQFTEDSPAQNDFLAQVSTAWENAADQAKRLDLRVVKLRLGLVLGANDGAFPRMKLPFQLFAGGPLGKGDQWVSWIHIEDVVQIIQFVLENEDVEGPINVVSPTPVKMSEFGKTLAKVMKRPYWLPAPSFALRLLLGEMSDLILKGQYVIPKRLQDWNYSYKYSGIKQALDDLIKHK